jgi:P4 family phage/plasmid primase-like protien
LSAIGLENDVVRIARGDARSFTTFTVYPEKRDEALASIKAAGQNAWFEVQRSSYMGDKGRSSEGHITQLVALYADIDFKSGDVSRPGMGSEHAALELLDEITRRLGSAPSAVVYSGHGIQPYWPVEDDGSTDRKQLLARWGKFVMDLAVELGGHVDNVFDLPRILRVPGPPNVKDPSRPEPTRVEVNGHDPLYVSEILEFLDDEGVIEIETEVRSVEIVTGMDDWDWAEQSCHFAHTAVAEIRESIPTSRHQWALKWSILLHAMIRYGCITEADYVVLRDALHDRLLQLCAQQEPKRALNDREFAGILEYGVGIAERMSKEKLSEEMRHHEHGVDQFPVAVQQPPVAEPAVKSNVTEIHTGLPVAPPVLQTDGSVALDPLLSPENQKRMMTSVFSDTGNAQLLAMKFSGKFIYVKGLEWLVWKNGRYAIDEEGAVIEAAKDVFGQMSESASEAMHKWGKKSLSRAGINAALALAESVPSVRVDPLDLDSKAEELVTPGGIVSLVDGSLRPADPTQDFNTLSTAVTPDFERGAPHFQEFLAWAFPDRRVISYLQKILGLALIGEVRQHVFPIWVGNGGNGKSVVAEVCVGLLGGYAAMMPRKFLVDTGHDPHPEVIARLRGIRLGIASEVPIGARLAEDLVKQISGEGTLTGRFMGENSFTFKNTCTMVMLANHLPSLPGGGASMRRRMRRIDFTQTVAEGAVNPMLVQQLIALEGPAILAWMIEGAQQVISEGTLIEPESVKVATDEYQSEEDYIGRFLSEKVDVVDIGMQVDRQVLFNTYRQWAMDNGINAINKIKFGREIGILYPQANAYGDVFAGLMLKMPKTSFAKEPGDLDA